MPDTSSINLVIFIIVMVIAIPLHEFGHAFAANYCGDDIPALQGRVTPEPWKHWDVFGTILIALGIFGRYPVIGWGKPVITDPTRYRNGKRGRLLVASAGIIVNLALALIGAAIYRGLHLSTGDPFTSIVCDMFVRVNIGLAIFNLLPIPPLDGSKILLWTMPTDRAVQWEQRFAAGGFLMVWLLMIVAGQWISIPMAVLTSFLLGQ